MVAAVVGVGVAGAVIGSFLNVVVHRVPRGESIVAPRSRCPGLVVAARGFDSDLLLELPFVAILIALAAIDLEHKILPNAIVYPAAVWGIIATAIVDPSDLPEHLIAGAGAFTFLLLAALAYPAGMGMGDVKLGGAMGLYLGLSIVPAMLIAFLAGTIVGVGLMAREGLSARKKGVPFGLFLALGGVVGVFAGPELIDLYEDAFLQ
jgi:leader peptidase (prepilin peptidase)/N-methyltransferase